MTKNKILSLFICVALLITSSCKEDPVTPDNEIDCTTNFENHSNATSFQSVVDQFSNNGFVGITVLVDDPIDGLWMGSAGYASIEDNVKMNPCHIHHTASLYKTYIATVILQLVDENKLNLEDKLSDHISAEVSAKIPNGDAVTIKNLLQQRTGIPDIFEIDFITDFFNDPMKAYTLEKLLEYVYDKEPLSAVDTEFHYSDANFTLLTLVIEKIEGNYVDALKTRIFEPLNLEDTYFLENPEQAPVGLADSYWDRYGDGNIENNSDIQIALTAGLSGSDGIVSTADDLKKFIKAVADGNLSTNNTLMTEFLAVPNSTQVYSGYGMGLMKVNIGGGDWYGHFGNQIGSGAIVLYHAEKDITFVALQNTGTFFSDEIKEKFFYELLRDFEAILL